MPHSGSSQPTPTNLPNLTRKMLEIRPPLFLNLYQHLGIETTNFKNIVFITTSSECANKSLDDCPDLIGIQADALPCLQLIAIRERPVREVNALTFENIVSLIYERKLVA